MNGLLRVPGTMAKLAVAAALLGGCDPEGPGAAGTISLASSVDPAGFATLQLRAYPDTEKNFDPAKIPSSTSAARGIALSEVTFPYHYDVGEGIGTSDSKQWRMVAWLSHDPEVPARPASGDPFCSAPFELKACSAGFGGYCTVSGEVDCTIE